MTKYCLSYFKYQEITALRLYYIIRNTNGRFRDLYDTVNSI